MPKAAIKRNYLQPGHGFKITKQNKCDNKEHLFGIILTK